MSRRNFIGALALSLLLHLLVVLLLWRAPALLPARLPEPTPQAPIQVEITEVMPPPPSTAAPPEVPDPGRSAMTRRQQGPGTPPPDASTPGATPDDPDGAEPGTDTPSGDVRPPLVLTPHPDGLGAPQSSGPAQTGRTIRPGDPGLSEWARRAEEEHRVKGRVDGWAADVAAENRAQRGLPHPYLTQVRDALREGLGSAEGGTAAELGAPDALSFLLNRYVGAAERFARTGNPGVIEPGLTPHQTERQQQFFGSESRRTVCDASGACTRERMIPWAQLLTQSAQTLQQLAHSGAMLRLTLELRQDAQGRPISQRIVEPSRSAKFDMYVLRVVPEALAELPPVPAEALRGQAELRSLWLIEGWPRLPEELDEAMTMWGAPAVQGIPLDAVMLQAAANERFRFRARLLRVY